MDKHDPHSRIKRRAAVELIAGKISRDDETEKEAQNRVSHLIGYAIAGGALVEASPGVFLLGELARWARDKWPSEFDHLPRILSADIKESAAASDATKAVLSPATLERARQVIEEMERRIDLQQEENDALRAENDALRPDAEAKRRQRATNRKNGGKRYK